MKKTAVIIFQKFCNYEFSVMLETLALAEKPITVFAKTMDPVRSEDSLTVIPDKTFGEINMDDYDSLILTGSMVLDSIINDEEMLELIRSFDNQGKIIGAISSAPMLLLRAGILRDRRILAAVSKSWFLPGGDCQVVDFTMEEMSNVMDYDEFITREGECGYLVSENLVTAMGWWFREWAMVLGEKMDIPIYPGSYRLDNWEKRN